MSSREVERRCLILKTYLTAVIFVIGAAYITLMIQIAAIQPVCYPTPVNLTCPDLPQPVCEAPIVTLPDCHYSQFGFILQDMAKEHNWSDGYNCQRYSEELARRLNDAGYDSSYITTTVNCDSGLFDEETCNKYGSRHTIVRMNVLYIEPQTGEPIPPSEYCNYGLGGCK